MKKIIMITMLFIGTFSLTGCNKADNIKHNISKEADSFGTYRKVTVINLRSDKILLEVEGLISIKDSTADELAILIRTGKEDYKMHYVYTGAEIVYLVEQLENTHTNPYHWDIRIFAVTPNFDIGRNE